VNRAGRESNIPHPEETQIKRGFNSQNEAADRPSFSSFVEVLTTFFIRFAIVTSEIASGNFIQKLNSKPGTTGICQGRDVIRSSGGRDAVGMVKEGITLSRTE